MMNFSIFTKPICRFLIHRYMGQYLKTEISSDQLELHLSDGTASVQKVTLNTEYINEILGAFGIVSLVEGWVDEISTCVPWKKLMTDSTVIKISGLQLTLTPLADINMANTQELVSSMIGSIASSMDLARSVIADEQIVDGVESAGVEQFASLIDQVISRIKVIFENLVIRVEAYSPETCTGLEIQIDRMEFHDEQLEARQQLTNAGGAITEQPASLYTVTDLNKLLHLQGVRLYTDLWTRDALLASSINDRLTSSRVNTRPGSEEEMQEMNGSTMLNFRSCYSHFSNRSTTSTSMGYAAGRSSAASGLPPNPILFAQLFSETRHTVRIRVNNTALTSCNESSAYNKRVDIEIFVGGSLYAFLSPSQLALLSDLLSRLAPRSGWVEANSNDACTAYGGLPMQEEHFQRLTQQFVQEGTLTGGCGLGGGAGQGFLLASQRSTWSGAEKFYELPPLTKAPSCGRPPSAHAVEKGQATRGPASASSALQRSSSLESTLSGKAEQKSNASTTTLVERRPDLFTLKLRVPTLVLAVSHDDPLSAESIRVAAERAGAPCGTDAQTAAIRAASEALSKQANDFFLKAASIKLAKKQLDGQRSFLSSLFHGDHLRLTANGSALSLTLISEQTRNSLQIEGSFEECDFVECLLPDSIVQSYPRAADQRNVLIEHFDLLNLSNRREIVSKDVFTFRMHNSLEKQHEYMVEVNMERCKTDADISIVDRVAHLLATRPSFLSGRYSAAAERERLGSTGPFGGLRDNFLPNAVKTDPPSSFALKFYMSEWIVDFRIPIADFSPERTDHYRKKSVHKEHLHAELQGVTLRVPKLNPANFAMCGEVILEAQSLIGTFVGDPNLLGCSHEEMCFLYANSTLATSNLGDEVDKRIRLRLSYDTRNKSLYSQVGTSMGASPPAGTMAKSMFESIFKPREEDQVEGPFSKISNYFADTRLIMAGSRPELEEFAEECNLHAKLNLEVSVPRLKVLLPSHKFVEVIYNRLANDLALWEPKCPFLSDASRGISMVGPPPVTLFRPFSADIAAGFTGDDFDPERRDYNLSHGLPQKPRRGQRAPAVSSLQSHKLAVTLRVEKANLLLQTALDSLRQSRPDAPKFTAGHFASELTNLALFLVYGFQENVNLSYFFLTSTKASVFHKNLTANEKGFCGEVKSAGFAHPHHRDVEIQAEPVPAGEPCILVEDDNVAVCLKLLFHPEENIKNILVAVALRNTLVHLRPFTDSKLFWACQLANFFTLIDYEVPGYELPIVKIDLHLRLASMLVGYNHSAIIPRSPMQLRLEIGSCDVTAQLMQEMERFKFYCLIEEAKLWLRRHRSDRGVTFDAGVPGGGGASGTTACPPFVKVAMVGLVHFVVAHTVATGGTAASMGEPMLELTCVNDIIKVWACSDTVVELLNMGIEFFQSEVGTYIFSSRPPSPSNIEKPPLAKNELLTDFVRRSNDVLLAASSHSGTDDATSGQPPSQAAAPSELSANERSRLVEMMASAMEEDHHAALLSAAVRSRRSARGGHLDQIAEIFGEGLGEVTSSDAENSSASTTNPNTDDEFIMVEKIPAASYGVTRVNSDRSTRLDTETFEIVQTPFRILPDVSELGEGEASSGNTPKQPPAILRYSINDISLSILLYGGSDFGDFQSRPQKTYSQWETRRDSGECADARRESQGGKFRDHTVCVEVKVSKASLLCELFSAAAPILSLNVLKVNDVEVIDRLLVSDIHKLFYQHVNFEAPKRLQTPLLSVTMSEDQQREGRFRISLAPLRLNFDQDTLEFLQDFAAYISTNVKWPEITTPYDPKVDLPVMEVPGLEGATEKQFMPPVAAPVRPNLGDVEICATRGLASFKARAEGSSESNNSTASKPQQSANALLEPADSQPNLEDLFSEEDVHLDNAFCAELSRELEKRETDSNSTTSLELRDICEAGEPKVEQLISICAGMDEGCHDEMDDPEPTPSLSNSAQQRAAELKPAPPTQRDTFFTEFTFSPACRIRLDYVGKRVKTDQGALIGLLIGLAELHRTELVLKELHNQRGLLGLNRCVQYALDEWLQDIRNRQIPNVIGSYAPISALVQLTQGFRDLFAIPLGELQKEDGQLMRGLQLGASNFGISTATAAIDATQRLASIVQNVAELAFDIVTPDYAFQRNRRHVRSSLRSRVAGDFREGVAMAYDTLSEGVRETASTLQAAAQEDRASGGTQWGLKGLLRHVTPTAIRPIVIASQATVQVLGGIKSQLHPEDHREELEKWKKREVPGRIVDQQQVRQSYNPSSLMAPYNYIPPPRRY